VSSELIFNQIQNDRKRLCSKKDLPQMARSFKPGVILMMGAGDIDTMVEPVKEQLIKNEGN